MTDVTHDRFLKHDPYYRLGVGMMILNHENKVLVCKRADMAHTDLASAWQMPQGGVDSTEEPYEAALREMTEEIGTNNVTLLAESTDWLSYDLPEELAGRLWGGRFVGQKQKWYLFRFDGYDNEINLDTKHPEFVAWKWIDPKDLPDLIVPFKRDLYKRIVAEFKPYFS